MLFKGSCNLMGLTRLSIGDESKKTEVEWYPLRFFGAIFTGGTSRASSGGFTMLVLDTNTLPVTDAALRSGRHVPRPRHHSLLRGPRGLVDDHGDAGVLIRRAPARAARRRGMVRLQDLVLLALRSTHPQDDDMQTKAPSVAKNKSGRMSSEHKRTVGTVCTWWSARETEWSVQCRWMPLAMEPGTTPELGD